MWIAMKALLERFPVSLFGIVLGISGLGTGWRVAASVWHTPAWIGETVLALAVLLWVLLTTLYLLKWLIVPTQALVEARSLIGCCYIGLTFVTMLLIAIAVLPYSRTAAICLSWIGWCGNVVFAAWRTGGLWRGGRPDTATTAVLYLPSVAGSFVSALAAGALGLRDLGTLFFGAGLFSWLAIESVVLHRLYTAEPMPAELRPSLGIQLAPPLVGCLAYLSINDTRADLPALALLGYGFFQALILIRLVPWFAKTNFSAGYWGFSFGVTALPLVLLRLIAGGLTGPLTEAAEPLFIAANLFVVFLTARTLVLLTKGRLLLPPLPAPAMR
jgi:tellurite resistance protein